MMVINLQQTSPSHKLIQDGKSKTKYTWDEHEHPHLGGGFKYGLFSYGLVQPPTSHFCPQLWKGNDMSASRGANQSNYVVLKPNKAMHGSGVWMESVFVFSSHEKTSELSGI